MEFLVHEDDILLDTISKEAETLIGTVDEVTGKCGPSFGYMLAIESIRHLETVKAECPSPTAYDKLCETIELLSMRASDFMTPIV